MKATPMTVSSPNVIEIKLDRLIDDMRLLRSQMIAFDRQLKRIEACLKSSERSEKQLEGQIEVRGGCYGDNKDSFDFFRSWGSNRHCVALSGTMTPEDGTVRPISHYGA